MASLDDKLELLEALEQKLYLQAKHDIVTFAETIEVPGTPTKDDPDKFYAEKLTLAAHHKLILHAVQEMLGNDEIDGLLIMMPPGSAKSAFGSVVVPAWVLGQRPGTNVIAVTYGQELTMRFARRVRQICRDPVYEKIMGTTVVEDNQAVEQWGLTNGSDYKASAIGAAITGMRADLIVMDDVVKDREAADSELIREKTWEAYVDNIVTRLKPGGKLMWIATRWHEDDVLGRVLGEAWKGQSGLWRANDGRLIRIINLPMVAEHKDDPLGRKEGDLLWKDWFREKDIVRLQEAAKKGGSAARTWSSLYQQRPAPQSGAILSRDYWQPWTKKVPECNFVFLCYDTAFEEGEENDPSAMTAWGLFEHRSKKPGGIEYNHHHAIMLGAWEERISAPDLADAVKFHNKLFQPDLILIEKRASGIQLVQELKRMRLPVKPWLPPGKPGAKGKVPRAHAVAHVLESGSVHYVPGKRTDKVLEQCAAFPYGTHDDMCLVAGTLIATRRGLIPIEDVRAGDEALTPQGWRRVAAAGFTGVRPVVSRGRLTGTGNHPVFSLKAGYIPLESVDTATMATVSKVGLWNLIKTIRRKPWNFSASHTGAWAEVAATTSVNQKATLGVGDPRGCMLPFGRPRMGRFQRAMRFTTRAAIHLIAAWKIWSAYRRLSIAHFLSRAWTWTNSVLTSIASAQKHPSGMGPKMAAVGTARTPSDPAPCNPGSTSGNAMWFWARDAAKSVGLSLNFIHRSKNSAQTDAQTGVADVRPVFNLTVEGAHCYFANGILVHNCDTVTMALSFFRRSGMFQTADDEMDKAEIEEALLRKTEDRRNKRTLYSGPIVASRYQDTDDDDMGPLRSMTPDSRRRFYGN